MKIETPEQAKHRIETTSGHTIHEIAESYRKKLNSFDTGSSLLHTKLTIGAHNGKLDAEEMLNYWSHELNGLSPKDVREIVKAIPKGGISIDESVKRYEEILKKMDRDGDGRINKDERMLKNLTPEEYNKQISHPPHSLPKLNNGDTLTV